MLRTEDQDDRLRLFRSAGEALGFFAAVVVVATSAIVVKETRRGVPLASLEVMSEEPELPRTIAASFEPAPLKVDLSNVSAPAPDHPAPAIKAKGAVEPVAEAPGEVVPAQEWSADPNIRYYDGRAIRPVKTIYMTVTAYSPDERSCGDSADGITASLKSVWTNGMKLVAADTRVLPFGSLISVPGYDEGRVVPVLDRGGAIKGKRLDVLYPTHEIALKWGVRRLPITVWEFVDSREPSSKKR
jgi:3D (Asp-Asp-Asp) domain-containing protein